MKKKIALLLITVIVVSGIFVFTNNRHAEIDEWSGQLVEKKINWAELSKGYGEDRRSYVVPKEEYKQLLELLRGINEECCIRGRNPDGERNDYRLSFYYEDKLYLLQCQNNKLIQLTFNDPETSAYYGCEDTPLYIDYPELWAYIVDTVEINSVKYMIL